MYPINKDAKHEALAGALAEVLADSVVLSHVVQGFHWNVKGADFLEYHNFFAGIYEDLDGSIDPTAENIIKLGFDAPYLLEDFLALTSIKAMRVSSANPEALLMDLAGHLVQIIACNLRAFSIATDCNEQGIANFLGERDDNLKKHMWYVAASLGMSVSELKQVLAETVAVVVDEYNS